jgi:hypothetical protein
LSRRGRAARPGSTSPDRGMLRDPTYVAMLLIRMTGVKKNEITPHQPQKSVMRVVCQKWLELHSRQKLPWTSLLKRRAISPMFCM